MANINKNLEKTKYPIIVEIIANRNQRFVDVHDPNFDKPLSELSKDYNSKGFVKLVTKISNYGIIS